MEEITKNNLRLKRKGNIYWSTVENIVTSYDSYSKKLPFDEFPSDFNLNYINELKHFIACCEGKEKPIAPLQDGIEHGVNTKCI